VRTTLTIDDDIAVQLKREARKTGDTFKQTVNRLLRQGLTNAGPENKREPFKVTPFPLGLKKGLSYDSISELLEEAEGPYHR
jgi:hypothetical protein